MTRRDVRSQFTLEPIAEEVLERILLAAHHAPSVGFSQLWDFIVIDDLAIRNEIKKMFVVENQRASMNYEGERREKYKSLKLEGILDTPVNLCITCDRSRTGPVVLGRNTLIEADLFSTCCAVQNLWLAAKSEGIGVGWVSILAHESLKDLLKLPESVIPVAYLCVSYVSEFLLEPELETVGWQKRSPLRQHIHRNKW